MKACFLRIDQDILVKWLKRRGKLVKSSVSRSKQQTKKLFSKSHATQWIFPLKNIALSNNGLGVNESHNGTVSNLVVGGVGILLHEHSPPRINYTWQNLDSSTHKILYCPLILIIPNPYTHLHVGRGGGSVYSQVIGLNTKRISWLSSNPSHSKNKPLTELIIKRWWGVE